MPYEGKYLARARKKLDEIRLENESEYRRRHKALYSLLPELKDIDNALTRQMAEICKISMGGSKDPDADLKRLRDENLSLQMKRAETLKAQGYPIDHLDSIYSCKRCKDTGIFEGGVCGCLDALYRREIVEDVLSRLPCSSCSFEDFDVSLYDDPFSKERMKAILSGCKKFAENYPNVSSGLLFQGGSGLGKTFLASCIARSLAEKGCTVCYESASAVFEAFETEKFSRSPEDAETASGMIREMLGCGLLIIDDLGSELTSSVSVSALHSIMSSRISKGRKTIICTCCTDDELKRRYGEQIYSRLKGDLVPLIFTGSDIRLKKRKL